MFCTNCGNQMSSEDSFCSQCGARVGDTAKSVETRRSSLSLPLMSSEEINQSMGRLSFWHNPSLIQAITYLHGILAFDQVLAEKETSAVKVTNYVTLQIRSEGFVLDMLPLNHVTLKTYKTAIAFQNVQTIALEEKDYIKEKKQSSIVGRALVGDLLFGPIGAIIGGMTGMRPQEISYDLVLTMVLEDTFHSEGAIVFAAQGKNRLAIDSFFRKHFSSCYSFNRIQST